MFGISAWLQRFLRHQHDEIARQPQPFSYEELMAPLEGASHYLRPLPAATENRSRVLSVYASPHGSSGKTIVLIHGFKMHALSWALVWNELRTLGHRVIALDLPGHGQSTLSQEALVLSSLSSDIRNVLDFFEVVDGALVGHSLGSFIAIRYLLDYPDHAQERASLGFACVACTAGNWQYFIGGAGGNWHGNLLMTTGLFDLLMRVDILAELLMAKKFSKPSLPAVRVVVGASRVGASRAALKAMSDFTWEHDFHPSLSTIRIPVVIVIGDLDSHHPHPKMSEALRRDFAATGLLRGYVVLKDVGHFMPLMQPIETVRAIERLWLL